MFFHHQHLHRPKNGFLFGTAKGLAIGPLIDFLLRILAQYHQSPYPTKNAMPDSLRNWQLPRFFLCVRSEKKAGPNNPISGSVWFVRYWRSVRLRTSGSGWRNSSASCSARWVAVNRKQKLVISRRSRSVLERQRIDQSSSCGRAFVPFFGFGLKSLTPGWCLSL